MTNIQKEVEACTYVLWPSEDVANTWNCYCLDLGVINYGSSPRETLTTTMVAAEITVEEERKLGNDPYERGREIKMLWKSKRVLIE